MEQLEGDWDQWNRSCTECPSMTDNEVQQSSSGAGIRATLWASAGLIVGAFYLGYYCAKFFLPN